MGVLKYIITTVIWFIASINYWLLDLITLRRRSFKCQEFWLLLVFALSNLSLRHPNSCVIVLTVARGFVHINFRIWQTIRRHVAPPITIRKLLLFIFLGNSIFFSEWKVPGYVRYSVHLTIYMQHFRMIGSTVWAWKESVKKKTNKRTYFGIYL